MIMGSRSRRQFPGPAGVIPKKIRTTEDSEDVEPSSQMETEKSMLDKNPCWKALVDYLDDQDSKSTSSVEKCPMKCMNINWIQTKAYRLPTCNKIPFVCAVLENAPELSNDQVGRRKTPCVKLIDETGTIEGALDAEFVQMHKDLLVPGTALALENAGILRWKSKRGLILTITSKNVICMTFTNPTNPGEKRKSSGDTSPTATTVNPLYPDVKIINFFTYSPNTIMQKFQDLIDPSFIIKQYQIMANESQDIDSDLNSSSCFGSSSSEPRVFMTINQNYVQQRVNSNISISSGNKDTHRQVNINNDRLTTTTTTTNSQEQSPTSSNQNYPPQQNNNNNNYNASAKHDVSGTFMVDEDDEDDSWLSAFDM